MTPTEHENPVAQAHARAAAAAEAAAEAKREEEAADLAERERVQRLQDEEQERRRAAGEPVQWDDGTEPGDPRDPMVSDKPKPDLLAMALEAPAHAIGDRILLPENRDGLGNHLSHIAIDKLGRLWRIDETEIVLVGRLQG